MDERCKYHQYNENHSALTYRSVTTVRWRSNYVVMQIRSNVRGDEQDPVQAEEESMACALSSTLCEHVVSRRIRTRQFRRYEILWGWEVAMAGSDDHY